MTVSTNRYMRGGPHGNALAGEQERQQEIVRRDVGTQTSSREGQTITLAHLAPFIDVSRRKIRRRLRDDFERAGIVCDGGRIDAIAESELVREVRSGCQTIQYQLITLHSTNGSKQGLAVVKQC